MKKHSEEGISCVWCKTLFTPRHGKHKRFCTKKCNHKFFNRNRTRKPTPLKKCVSCNQPFTPKLGGGRWEATLYCSPLCKKTYTYSKMYKDIPGYVYTPRAKEVKTRFDKVNISRDKKQQLLESQGGVCKICKKIRSDTLSGWHLDHDHTTGRVRGVLCRGCNLGLGNFQDSMERLLEAAEYLKYTEKRLES